jgi:hypothetical protein
MTIADRFKGNPLQANGIISIFGGREDYKSGQDNGKTRCGFVTYDPDTDRDFSHMPYVALPESLWERGLARCGMTVTIIANGRQVTGIVYDLGPSESLGRIADVSPGIAKQLNFSGLTTATVVLGTMPNPTPTQNQRPCPDRDGYIRAARLCLDARNKCVENAKTEEERAGCERIFQKCLDDQQRIFLDCQQLEVPTEEEAACARCSPTEISSCINCIGAKLARALKSVGINLAFAAAIAFGVYLFLQER